MTQDTGDITGEIVKIRYYLRDIFEYINFKGDVDKPAKY